MGRTLSRMTPRLERTAIYGILVIALLAVLTPVIWLFLMSLKTRSTIFTLPPPLFFTPTSSNYEAAFVDKGYFHFFYNSLIVSIGSTGLALLAGPLAAYSFSRFKFLADKHLFFWLLTFRMSPVIVYIVPYFMLWTTLGLFDTHLGLILAHTTFTLPVVTWLMKGFFDDLPREIEEAALVDGCSRISALRRIVLPLSAPGLTVAAILSFIFSWNEFFFAMVLTSTSAKTMPAAITAFITTRGTLWGEMAAVSVVIIIPVLLFALMIQRYLVRGLTFGAVR